MAKELEPFPVVPQNPMGHDAYARGEMILKIFKDLVEIFTCEDANLASFLQGPSEHNKDAVLAIAPSNRTRTVSYRTTREPSDDDTRFSAIQRDKSDLRHLLQGFNDTQEDKPKSAKGEVLARQSGARAATIISQLPPIPGEYVAPLPAIKQGPSE